MTQESSASVFKGAPGAHFQKAPVLVGYDASQDQALDLSCHTAVEASAGSGKTRVLVGRFLRILEQGRGQPHEIVAITFMEKAASQIAHRIQSEILAKLSLASSLEEKTLWRGSLEALGESTITTLHGFCLSIIREFGSRVGVGSDFEVLAGGNQRLLLDRCLQDMLEIWSQNRQSSFRIVLEYLPYEKVHAVLTELIQRRNHLEVKCSQDEQEFLQRVYKRETAHFLSSSGLWGCVQRLLDCVPEELLAKDDSYSLKCVQQRQLLKVRSNLEAIEFLIRFKGTLDLSARPSRAWSNWKHQRDLANCWKALKHEFNRYPLEVAFSSKSHPNGDVHFKAAIKALGELSALAQNRYQFAKHRDSLVDFEDLLNLAHSLVRLPDVQAQLRKRYRFYLVDEFQDTSRLQWEILKPLIGHNSNFFTVGDDKQSIYRFREADVSVFRQVRQWIRKQGQVVQLRYNYRSSVDLVSFNNLIFQNLMIPGLDYEAIHQVMESSHQKLDSTKAAVQGLLYETLPKGFEKEAELVAATAKMLLSEGFKAHQIGILLRNRTRLRSYETAFCRWGLPFTSRAGTRLYDQPEIVDLTNLLAFLHDPRLDLELLGVLRSPLFSFSDEDLLLLSLRKGDTVWGKLRCTSSTDQIEPSHWIYARESLQNWLNVPGETAAGILRRIVSETGYDQIVSAGARGRMALTSIRRLMELVRQFEIEHGPSRRPLIRHLDGLRRIEPHDGGCVEEASDLIQIHTIHGAKGLEFPAVIFPDLGGSLLARRNASFYGETLDGGDGIQHFFGLSIRDPDKEYKEYHHPVYEMLRRLGQYRQIAEEKRLLYVALTRAQERLVLIGKRSRQQSYALWLKEAGAESSIATFPWSSGLSTCQAGSTNSGKTNPMDAVPAKALISRPNQAGEGQKINAAQASLEKTTWTATEIVSYHRCARKYYLSQLGGLGETGSLRLSYDPADLVSSAVNKLLEDAESLENKRGLDRFLKRWSVKWKHLYSGEAISQMNCEVRDNIKRVKQSALQERLSSARRVYSERQFNVLEQGRLVTGVVDKLFQDSEGGWAVVDFKTSRRETDVGLEGLLQSDYRLQVQLYLWAMSRIMGTVAIEGNLFFTDDGHLITVEFDEGVMGRCCDLVGGLPRDMSLRSFPRTRDPQDCSGCTFKERQVCPGAGRSQAGHEE